MQGLPCKGQHVRIIKCKWYGKSDSCFSFSWLEAGPTASDTSLASIAAAWATKPISFGSFIMAPFTSISRKSWLRQLRFPLEAALAFAAGLALGFLGDLVFLALDSVDSPTLLLRGRPLVPLLAERRVDRMLAWSEGETCTLPGTLKCKPMNPLEESRYF